MSIINLCLWMYIFLKPFYLFGSGNIQPSDLFIVVAFGLTLLTKKRKELINKNTIYIFVFFVFVLIINLIYFLQFDKFDFIHSTLYYFFIMLGVMVFNTKIQDKKFWKICYYIFIINIIIQFVIYLAGIGKYWKGSSRYMGTLTDPNQFAFFIFLCLMYLYILENILLKKRKILIYIIGIVLIFFSSSTGMLLAVAIFLIATLVLNKQYLKRLFNLLKNKKFLCVLFLITVFFTYEIVFLDNWDGIVKVFNDNIIESSLFQRTVEKFDKASSSDDNLAEDRNLDMLYNNWEYCFIGAGEGDYSRFDSGGEIHSTIPSILFYYGLIPTSIVICWIFKNLKGIGNKNLIPYIAIFIESFTLLNQRQLLLWVFIMLAVNIKKENIAQNERIEADDSKKQLLFNSYTCI